ncbi:4878_t:CDS:1 [Acaulospora colombiana]|uniref:4878_t:CDS:1 n=1 Tax=Acaulospora colombiana TaxID=27376 RepID=A0ACA9KQU2_9GLOM|nr:4878_t:CDS:1 [Acaulospora colombiana]
MNDKANSGDDQLESTNNDKIMGQDRGGLTQDNSNTVNQQTENAECENGNIESQLSKDAPGIRRRRIALSVPPTLSKSTNTSSESSTSSTSAGEGSSGTKNTNNSATINGASEYECNIW